MDIGNIQNPQFKYSFQKTILYCFSTKEAATSMPTGEKGKSKVIQQNFSVLLDAPEINSDFLPAFSYVFLP